MTPIADIFNDGMAHAKRMRPQRPAYWDGYVTGLMRGYFGSQAVSNRQHDQYASGGAASEEAIGYLDALGGFWSVPANAGVSSALPIQPSDSATDAFPADRAAPQTIAKRGSMRLGEFIAADMELIQQKWEAFAATCLPGAGGMSSRSLRDHLPGILQAIVADLANPQSSDEQAAKSMGLAPVTEDAPHTAAQAHAVLRAESGFNIEQLVAEYRALRASVLSGWMEASAPEPGQFTDMLRFNEAIDQALAESIAFFAAHVAHAHSLLIAMLSHDMRSPLQTIQVTARALSKVAAKDDVEQVARRLVRAGDRMQKLLDDQIDFNRSELGLGIWVKRRPVDLGPVCMEEIEQIRAAHAERALELKISGDCRGAWDSGRIQQLLNNLVVNAVHYGEPKEAIHVALLGGATDVCLTVANAGETIDGETLARIFEPMRRGRYAQAKNDSGLGLGLYIASEIAKAHGGAIAADSQARKTVFTVKLPKRVPLAT